MNKAQDKTTKYIGHPNVIKQRQLNDKEVISMYDSSIISTNFIASNLDGIRLPNNYVFTHRSQGKYYFSDLTTGELIVSDRLSDLPNLDGVHVDPDNIIHVFGRNIETLKFTQFGELIEYEYSSYNQRDFIVASVYLPSGEVVVIQSNYGGDSTKNVVLKYQDGYLTSIVSGTPLVFANAKYEIGATSIYLLSSGNIVIGTSRGWFILDQDLNIISSYYDIEELTVKQIDQLSSGEIVIWRGNSTITKIDELGNILGTYQFPYFPESVVLTTFNGFFIEQIEHNDYIHCYGYNIVYDDTGEEVIDRNTENWWLFDIDLNIITNSKINKHSSIPEAQKRSEIKSVWEGENGNMLIDFANVLMDINPTIIERKKLTPKTDFLYGTGNNAPDEYRVYNSDLTEKLVNTYNTDIDVTYIQSVGKGQVGFIDIDTSVNEVQFKVRNKNGTAYRSIKIDDYSGSMEKYWKTQDRWVFIGQAFLDRGDEDRYVIVVQNTLTDNGFYYPSLFNIDKWEYKNPRTTTGYASYADFVYDGINMVYICYNKERIQTGDLNTWYTDRTTLGELQNAAGVNTAATNIYGMNESQIYYRDTLGNLSAFTLETKEVSGLGTGGEDMSSVMFPNNSFRSFIRGSSNNIQLKGNGTSLDITESLNSLVTYTPTLHRPQVLLDYFEDTTKVEFTMVYTWKVTQTHLVCFKTTITKSDSSVVSELIGDKTLGSEIGIIDQLILNNSFNNTCNMYDIGKFYNYGLQKQYNNIIATIEE